VDPATQKLFEQVADCGRELGLSLTWRSSGGVSDGNKLAAAGLPVIDTLGPRGGGLHSAEEFLLLDSLTERAKLTALLLMKLGSGEFKPMQSTDSS
jgi:glutamate carboxypeptidase